MKTKHNSKKTYTVTRRAPANSTARQARPKPAPKAEPKIGRILLGMDVHGKFIVAVRKLGGASPQPAQRFGRQEFLAWAARQVELAEAVFACYEAGPFGFRLQ